MILNVFLELQKTSQRNKHTHNDNTFYVNLPYLHAVCTYLFILYLQLQKNINNNYTNKLERERICVLIIILQFLSFALCGSVIIIIK